LVSATDRAVVTPELSGFIAARRRHSISTSIWGWFDDDLSEMKPWGFEIDSIKVPVSIWHGEDDKFVPRSHAEWLMAKVPAATRHMLPGEGHWSIKERRLDEVLDALTDAARLSREEREGCDGLLTDVHKYSAGWSSGRSCSQGVRDWLTRVMLGAGKIVRVQHFADWDAALEAAWLKQYAKLDGLAVWPGKAGARLPSAHLSDTSIWNERDTLIRLAPDCC
jgi:hypothetical protein